MVWCKAIAKICREYGFYIIIAVLCCATIVPCGAIALCTNDIIIVFCAIIIVGSIML